MTTRRIVKIRLEGTKQDVDWMTQELDGRFELANISKDYQSGRWIRRYITIQEENR